MPTLPWTVIRPAAPHTEVFVMASRLEVASPRHVPRFLWLSLAAWRQVRRAPGGVGASLVARLLGGVFWTLSAWESKEALYAYARAEPHRSTMKRLRPAMRQSQFVIWTVPADQLPVSWDEARRRLEEARAQQP